LLSRNNYDFTSESLSFSADNHITISFLNNLNPVESIVSHLFLTKISSENHKNIINLIKKYFDIVCYNDDDIDKLYYLKKITKSIPSLYQLKQKQFNILTIVQKYGQPMFEFNDIYRNNFLKIVIKLHIEYIT